MTMKTTNATIVKSTSVPRKSPRRNCSGDTSHLRQSPCGITALTSGITRSATIALTILPNAPPMTTATARSTTLPLLMNSLNSFSTFMARTVPEAGAAQTGKLRKAEYCRAPAMKGFLLGLVVAGVGFGGYYYWKEFIIAPASNRWRWWTRARRRRRRARRRRSAGAARCASPATRPPGRRRARAGPGRRRRRGGRARAVKLSAADLKLVSQGDDLSRPDVVHLGDATDDSGSRELTQDDIDAKLPRQGGGDPRLHLAGAARRGHLRPGPRDGEVPHPAHGQRARRARRGARDPAEGRDLRLHQGRRRRHPVPALERQPGVSYPFSLT